jgi:phospholipid/cholesterol/gamma-HCH transport system substrate-binding protein
MAVNAAVRRDLIKLIIFLVFSVLITLSLVATLLDSKFGQPQSSYSAMFTNATDLESGDVVRIAGVEVGKVTSVTVTKDDRAKVMFTVASAQHLTTTSTASIQFENLLGQRYLQIAQGPQLGAPLRNGGQIPESQTQPGLDLTTVFTGFQPLIAALDPAQVNQLTGSIIEILQGESGAVSNLINQTATLTTNLASRQQVINELVDNLTPLLTTVNQNDSQLAQLIQGLDKLVTGLAGQRDQVGGAITGLAQLNDETNSLYNGIEPALDQDLQGLRNVTDELTTSQGQLNQTGQDLGATLAGLPGLLNALDKASDHGSFLTVYICDLTITTTNPISVKLSSGVPQSPPLSVPTGLIGVPTDHTPVCAVPAGGA